MTAYVGLDLGKPLSNASYSSSRENYHPQRGVLTEAEQAWLDPWLALLRNNSYDPVTQCLALYMKDYATGRVILDYAFGNRNIEEKALHSTGAICSIRSVSKALTAILGVKWAAENRTEPTIKGRIDAWMDQSIDSWTVINNNLVGRSIASAAALGGILDRTGHDFGDAVDTANTTMREFVCHTNGCGQVISGSSWGILNDGAFNLANILNLSASSLDDIVAHYDRISYQLGPSPVGPNYDDKNAMIVGAAVEEDAGIKLRILIDNMFATLGISGAYAAYGGGVGTGAGAATFYGEGAEQYLAVPLRTDSPPVVQLVAAVGNATAEFPANAPWQEIHYSNDYAFGLAQIVMSAKAMADFGDKIHDAAFWVSSGFTTLNETQAQEVIDEIFKSQTGAPDDAAHPNDNGVYSGLVDPFINWGYGPEKAEPVGPSNEYEVWGSVGFGGFAGAGTAYARIEGLGVVCAANGNGAQNGVPGYTDGFGLVYGILESWANTFG